MFFCQSLGFVTVYLCFAILISFYLVVDPDENLPLFIDVLQKSKNNRSFCEPHIVIQKF